MPRTAPALFTLALTSVISACAAGTAEVTVAPITPSTPEPETSAAPSPSATALASHEAEKLLSELNQESAMMQGALDKGDKGATPVGGGLAAPGSGTPPNVGGPTVRLLPAKVSSPVEDVASVLTGLRSGFVRCFNKALQRDPAMTGSFALEAKLNNKGEVVGVKAVEVKGVSADVVGCINQVMRSARFKPPQGGSAVLTLPLTMSPQ